MRQLLHLHTFPFTMTGNSLTNFFKGLRRIGLWPVITVEFGFEKPENCSQNGSENPPHAAHFFWPKIHGVSGGCHSWQLAFSTNTHTGEVKGGRIGIDEMWQHLLRCLSCCVVCRSWWHPWLVVMVVVAMVKSLDPAVATQLLIVFPWPRRLQQAGLLEFWFSLWHECRNLCSMLLKSKFRFPFNHHDQKQETAVMWRPLGSHRLRGHAMQWNPMGPLLSMQWPPTFPSLTTAWDYWS